ncbi:hypothetical protein APR50_10805 [Variovorax paradoxus]|nr:sensor histidine kinase [Xenophilus azovorans]KPU99404.1 hypothetical protein APR52_02965 [Variovorax paradoxus]MBN8746469.1 sensor histidine kinase [Variovorax sp.]VTY38145.1 Sensor protein RstB [Xylophilus ampelinus]KPV08682.1 hypothetical protein APR50_10805 [Variovorax paradoxus]KPV15311.1 hypothetical protein APR51_35150 [Variovorax paradoxus]
MAAHDPAEPEGPAQTVRPVRSAMAEVAAVDAAWGELRERLARHKRERRLLLAGVSYNLNSSLARPVLNLLDSAFRHGGPPVVLRLVTGGGRGRIEVDDAGPGVALADRERELQAFARGDPSRGARGTGLGPAVAAQVTARLRGSVSIEVGPVPAGSPWTCRWSIERNASKILGLIGINERLNL